MADDLMGIERKDLRALSRRELEDLAWRLAELSRSLANRLDQDSSNSSRPPSSDAPWERGSGRTSDAAARGKSPDDKDGAGPDAGSGDGGAPASSKPAPKPSGKRPGMPGHWRRQPLVVSGQVDHDPVVCAACGAGLGEADRVRQDSAHYVYELERGAMALQVSAFKHCYFVKGCGCGHRTVARPGHGRSSQIDGRRRDLTLTERCLVGPALAAFIAVLSVRFRLSRQKIQEFLVEWLGLELGTATINRCIHEFGLACEPVVEDLVAEMRAAEVVHLDETPWYQHGRLSWLWVAVTQNAVVFRIGSRGKAELTALIGEAFLGWLVSDGYAAYRDHPRRQRCLAHLIRKAVALAEGYYRAGSAFGHDLQRDLRRLIERVAQGDDEAGLKRLVKSIQRTCQCHQDGAETKVRALAREILNDWQAVIAFVDDPRLPPTNNDAERALRHAVIARRISYGTRTDEGSRFYAAALSIIETCRKRCQDIGSYARNLIATARIGLTHPRIALPRPP